MFSPPSACVLIKKLLHAHGHVPLLLTPLSHIEISPCVKGAGSYFPMLQNHFGDYSPGVVMSVEAAQRPEAAAGERSLCSPAAGAAGAAGGGGEPGCSAAHRGRENKRQSARSSDTKPGHAAIMRPAQWVANKRGALLNVSAAMSNLHSPHKS